jgi:hypothetical protein
MCVRYVSLRCESFTLIILHLGVYFGSFRNLDPSLGYITIKIRTIPLFNVPRFDTTLLKSSVAVIVLVQFAYHYSSSKVWKSVWQLKIHWRECDDSSIHFHRILENSRAAEDSVKDSPIFQILCWIFVITVASEIFEGCMTLHFGT